MYSDSEHWQECSWEGCPDRAGSKTAPEAHGFDDACDTDCNDSCGYIQDVVGHIGGTATCTEKAVCESCGASYGNIDENAHAYGSEWKTDANEHWNECACGDKANKSAHTDSNNDGKCDTCEYHMSNGGGNTETPDTDVPGTDKPEDPKDGLSGGAIAGIVIGAVAVLGGGGFALFWFVIKKKKTNK